MDHHHTTQQFYDRLSHAYDLLANSSEHRAMEDGLKALGTGPEERVLEIGFGTGHALEDLARQVDEGGRVTGIDLSYGMRRVAAKRLAKAGLDDRVDLLLADGEHLPFADDSFDGVFTSFTLELFEVETIPRVLAEVRRVLRPGGRLAVVAMQEGGHGPLFDLYKWLHRHFPHFIDCQPIEAGALLEAAGFGLEHEETTTIWSLPIAVLVGRAPHDD
jgi:demethylmenaquinone methyltransferase/2-methoxy-6-polyprenyl-1,4-benzoquinol methylase